MAFFKSAEEIEKERERKSLNDLRAASRKVMGVVYKLEDHIEDCEKKNRATWEDAKRALAAGDKRKALFLVQTYQHGQRRYLALEKKRWIFESYTEKIEMMKVDVQMGSALKMAGQFISLDVDAMLDETATLDGKLSDYGELSREWDRLFDSATKSSHFEEIPSTDTLLNDLFSEIKGTQPATPVVEVAAPVDAKEKEKQIEGIKSELNNL